MVNQSTKPVLKFYKGSNDTLLTEGKLISFWEDFKTALLKNDLGKLKILSANCIACENCGEKGAIPIDKFFEKYFTQSLMTTF